MVLRVVITAALSAALVATLSFLGISLSPMQVAAVVVAMKVLVVLAVFLIGYRVKRKRAAQAEPPSANT